MKCPADGVRLEDCSTRLVRKQLQAVCCVDLSVDAIAFRCHLDTAQVHTLTSWSALSIKKPIFEEAQPGGFGGFIGCRSFIRFCVL